MRKFLLGALALLGGVALFTSNASAALTFSECPAIGSGPSCAFRIEFGKSTTSIIDAGFAAGAGRTYDSAFGDDTLIGLFNDANSGRTLTSVVLGSTKPIFGFDGDGACAIKPAACTTHDSTGYGPNGVTFSPLSFFQGTVLFPALAPGQTAWFSLEAEIPPGTIHIGGIPELSTWAMMIIGFVGVGMQLHRRKSGAYVSA